MKNISIEWQGCNFDSNEEVYFAYWLDELKDAGYIHKWERQTEPYKLTNGLYHDYEAIKVLKTKVKTEKKKQTLLRKSEYTPDFNVYWSDLRTPERILLWQDLIKPIKIIAPFISQDGVSVVEVKPVFDAKNMERLFNNNQKFMWDKFKVFVNLVHPFELFKKTFTPKEFMLTKTGKARKITKWKPITLKQFLDDEKSRRY